MPRNHKTSRASNELAPDHGPPHDTTPDRISQHVDQTETPVGRAARHASLAFPLRPASSRGDRGPGEQLEAWSGEIVEHGVPVARPLRDSGGVVLRTPGGAVVREVHHHYAAPPVELAPDRVGVRWDRVTVYVFGLVMLAVFVALLAAAGVLDLSLPAPPWQSGGSR